MKQIRYVEWCDPELIGTGPFLVNVATMMGLYWAGYAYDHEGD